MSNGSFYDRLNACMTADRGRFLKLKRHAETGDKRVRKKDLEALNAEIDVSIQKKEARIQRCPVPKLDTALPIAEHADEIRQHIVNNQVVIVCGETGSGKTTQLPLIALQAERGQRGLIGHTQPRRIAARTIADRLASELHEPVGQTIGYQVRFTDKSNPDGYIKVMTDGILLAETNKDPWLSAYDTIIIDEAHERSLNIDFLLGFLKRLLKKRPDLKLIITSATIDAERFSKHFDNAPVIEVSGRLYPVSIRYRPLDDVEADKKRDADTDIQLLTRAIGHAVDEAQAERPGDMLVFLPGEREIRETRDYLKGRLPAHTRILPLYARQSVDEQRAVFAPSNATKIVLATNVAETSLTVPGIRYVIDTGLARVKRYNYRQKVEQLQIERIAQASANQRAGRCGRVSEGVCFRLYEESDFLSRPAYPDPEILRASLAGVILKMNVLRLGDVDDFPFIDAPWPKMVAEGYRILHDIGALTKSRRLTQIGRQIARLPLDPKIARIMLGGVMEGCLSEMLVLCAALSVQDPREHPLDAQTAADTAHRRFFVPGSEFASLIKLWQYLDGLVKGGLSRRKFASQCKAEFLSYLRVREWRDVHQQLVQLANEEGWKQNPTAASEEKVASALLSGFCDHIGMKSEDNDGYIGPQGIHFWIHPSSLIKKKGPKWLMAAELTETSRLYARTVAEVQPEWIERVASHLVKRHYENPYWAQSQGKVMASEKVLLHGLPIITGRPVHYGPIDPKVSRDIFIRSALVEGQFSTRAAFWSHNQSMLKKIAELEHKSRRPNILVDDETRFAFYDARIPADITQQATFDRWRQVAEAENPKILFFTEADLMRRDASDVSRELYPAKLKIDGVLYGLSYWHEPGSFRDGVTLTVPLSYINQVDTSACEWLVPGLLKEKVTWLTKSLPQRIRATLIPMPAFVEAFMDAFWQGTWKRETPLPRAIIEFSKQERNTDINEDELRLDKLPEHLRMNYKLVDDNGRQLGMSRSLETLRREFGQMQTDIAVDTPFNSEDITNGWTFGDLPDQFAATMRSGRKKTLYPAIADMTDGVKPVLVDTQEEANTITRTGLIRLLWFRLSGQVKQMLKQLGKNQSLCAAFLSVGNKSALETRFIESVFTECFLRHTWPKSAQSFDTWVNNGKRQLMDEANRTEHTLIDALTQFSATKLKLKQLVAFPLALADIQNQLDELVSPQFWLDVPAEQLRHYPRYLQAIQKRIEQLRADPSRDKMRQETVQRVLKRWQEAKERTGDTPAIQAPRWAIEELRVSLFAQELKTPYPVSEKRIEKLIEQALKQK